jgi:peptidoglycan/LPS O-acetylase OafA/YrhL
LGRITATATTARQLPQAQPARRPQLPALTAIRFFAALHVVFYHAHCTAWSTLPPWLERLRDHGDTAVALFYVLSGFILTYTHIAPDGKVDDARRFWAARIARIWPLYALALLGIVAFKWHVEGGFGNRIASLIASATMLQAWTPDLIFGWNTPGWSLSVELFFYLAFPFVALPIARMKTQRALFGTGLALWLLGIALVLLHGRYGLDWRMQSIDDLLAVVEYNPLARMPEFAIGVVVGRLFALQPAWLTARTAGWLVVGGIGASVAAVCVPDVPRIWLHQGLLAPAFGALILGLTVPKTRAVGLLSHPWLVRLGDASFAVYILQEPVMDWYFWARAEPFGRDHSLGVILGHVAWLVALSLLCWKWVEVPAQRWLRKRLVAWIDAGPRKVARWPAPGSVAVAGLLVAAAAWAMHRAPEQRAWRPSRVGELLQAWPQQESVAWDAAAHGNGHYRATLFAIPDLKLLPFASDANEVPAVPFVVAGKDWPQAKVLQARYVDGEPDGNQALWLLPAAGPLPSVLQPKPSDTVYGSEPVAGVQESGWDAVERSGSKTFRWTHGRATLRIPLTQPPRQLLLNVYRPRPGKFQVEIGGRVVHESRVGPGAVQQTIDLGGMAVGDVLDLALVSETFSPGPSDPRELGVLVYGVWVE